MSTNWLNFLVDIAGIDADNSKEISNTFVAHEIELPQLTNFTFEFLERCGITKMGLVLKILVAKDRVVFA
jgi:hypothetical protein